MTKDMFDSFIDMIETDEANQEHSRVLDEHAEYLRALIAIDSLLDKLGWAHVAELPFIYSEMRTAMPPSIVATRKGKE